MLYSKSKVVYAEPMLFMTPLKLPDTSKARDQLGWMPLVSLESGLEKTIADLRANKGIKGINRIGSYGV